MGKPDRKLQRDVLEWLSESYPKQARIDRYPVSIDKGEMSACVAYLAEYSLVEVTWFRPVAGAASVAEAKITAKGLDFLADDGGLGAILSVVTVRLHGDTIKELIAERIDMTDLPAEEKSALKKRLETMTAEALKVATQEAVKAGLSRIPDAIGWLKGLGIF